MKLNPKVTVPYQGELRGDEIDPKATWKNRPREGASIDEGKNQVLRSFIFDPNSVHSFGSILYPLNLP